MTAYLDRVRRLGEGQPSLRVRARSRFEPVPSDAEPPWERSADAASPPPSGAETRVPGERRPAWAEPRAAGPARQRPVPADPAPGLAGPSVPDPAPGLSAGGRAVTGSSAGPSPGRPASRAAAGPQPHRDGHPGADPARQTWVPRSVAGVRRSHDVASQGRPAASGDTAGREGTGQVRPPEPGRRRSSADEAGDRPAATQPGGKEPGTATVRPAGGEPGTAAPLSTGRSRPDPAPQPDGPEGPTSAAERSRVADSGLRSAQAATNEQDSRPSFAPAFPAWLPELSGDRAATQARTGHPGLRGFVPADGEPDQVTVTIGRVDVRVGPPEPATPGSRPAAQPGRRATRPRPGRLEDYLRARAAGRVG